MGWFKKKKPLKLLQFRKRLKLEGISAAILSDIGCTRTNNEDGAIICYPENESVWRKKGIIFILTDGMGGHNSGEVASELALTTFGDSYYNASGNIVESLKEAFISANNFIYETAQTNDAYIGMGTTLTAIVILNENLYLAHIGDSRAYLFRNENVVQLSKDHTVVQQLIDMGEISAEEALNHPQKNMLLCALGTKPEIEPDIFKIEMQLGHEDIILLCSDGLYEFVSNYEISAILSTVNNIEVMANRLVDLAKKNGGHDNITVLLATRNELSTIPQLKNTSDFEIPVMNENLQS